MSGLPGNGRAHQLAGPSSQLPQPYAPWIPRGMGMALEPARLNCQYWLTQINTPDGVATLLQIAKAGGDLWSNILFDDWGLQFGSDLKRVCTATQAGLILPPPGP